MLRPGIVLCIVSVVAAICLSYVYDITKKPIERQQTLTEQAAMKEVLSIAEFFEEAKHDNTINSLNIGYDKEKNIVGYVVGISEKGYAGAVNMLVGISKDKTILGVKITKHSETPGLGANAANDEFLSQFTGKEGKGETLLVTKSATPNNNEITAITSATITSKTVVKGVNAAISFIETYKQH